MELDYQGIEFDLTVMIERADIKTYNQLDQKDYNKIKDFLMELVAFRKELREQLYPQ